MPRITAIKVQERRKKRRAIFVDDAFFCGVDQEVVTALKLQPGQEIETEQLQRITRTEEEIRVRERCLRLLDHRARTRRELSDRLRQDGVETGVAEHVLDRLQSQGLVDDRVFAFNFVRDRARGGGVGKRRLQNELLRRGVAREIIAQALDEEMPGAEDEDCVTFALRKAPSYQRLPQAVARRRLTALLTRRGYQWTDIRPAVERALPEETEDS